MQELRRANLLGDVRAEADSPMLDVAFFETPDYRTLIESTDKTVVVGRRGTGKSALRYQLGKYWGGVHKCAVVEVTPEEDEIIGLRPLVGLFGNSYNQIKAGARIACRYALLMEVACALDRHYKFDAAAGAVLLRQCLKDWRSSDAGITARLRRTLDLVLDKS